MREEAQAALHERYDYLIVGSGLYGATFAREMLDHEKSCLVIDRRPHLGGNVYCEERAGVTVHKYGAHIFHTNRDEIWNYVCRYVTMRPYVHRVVARNGDKTCSLPFNMYTFEQLWGITDPEEARKRLERERSYILHPSNLEEQALSLVGRDIYETLIKHYTEKQWGRPCRDLPPSIIKRLPLRYEYDDRYFTDAYQGIPEGGYNRLIEKLLDGAVTITGLSYQELAAAFPDVADKVIYTGSIDQFFDYRLGCLEYRSLRFMEELLEQPAFQDHAVINYCDAGTAFTRIIEHKRFAGQKGAYTVITREYPEEWCAGKEPYYPINDERNTALYRKYLALADERPDVIFGGRLGEYRYYDMDQVVMSALKCAQQEFP